MDACDADVQSHCPLASTASADGTAIHVETPNLNVVRDCLWSEVQQDRDALAEAAGISGASGATAGSDGSDGAGQRRALAAAAHAAGGGWDAAAAAAAAHEPASASETSLQGVSAQVAAAFLRTAAAAQRRRLQQGDAQAAGHEEGAADDAAVAVMSAPRRSEPVLSPACRAFLDVALPGGSMAGMGTQGAVPCFSLFKPSWHSFCCTGFSGHAAPTFPLCPQPTGLMSSRELRPRPLCLPPCMNILSCCNLPLSLAAADRFDEFQGAMTATAVVTQLAAIESSLGLKEGTLHNPGECKSSCLGICRPLHARVMHLV